MAARRSYPSFEQIAVCVCILVLSLVLGWDSPTSFKMDEKVDAEKLGTDGQGHTYLRVSSASDPESRSTDSLLDESENIQRSTSLQNGYLMRGYKAWSGSRSPGASYMAVALGIWCVFSYLNFSLDTRASIQTRHIPTLDMSYHENIDLDIVLNMYDEEPASAALMISEIRSLPSIANKTTRVLIHYKGED